jgi:hypothetical protein
VTGPYLVEQPAERVMPSDVLATVHVVLRASSGTPPALDRAKLGSCIVVPSPVHHRNRDRWWSEPPRNSATGPPG